MLSVTVELKRTQPAAQSILHASNFLSQLPFLWESKNLPRANLMHWSFLSIYFPENLAWSVFPLRTAIKLRYFDYQPPPNVAAPSFFQRPLGAARSLRIEIQFKRGYRCLPVYAGVRQGKGYFARDYPVKLHKNLNRAVAGSPPRAGYPHRDFTSSHLQQRISQRSLNVSR